MIELLKVKNFALIDELEVRFGSGLNVLTGETGAGKSILMEALSLLLGKKPNPGTIRTGRDSAEVFGVLRPQNSSEIIEWLRERELELEDGSLLVRRLIKKEGRSSSYVQGSLVTQAELARLTAGLFDLHGQHEHQSLLKIEKHRFLVDDYANLTPKVARLTHDFNRLASAKKKLAGSRKSENERRQKVDYLRFAIQEIEDAALKENEINHLEQERQILIQGERLFDHLQNILELLAESETESGLPGLRRSANELRKIAAIDERQQKLAERLDSVFYETQDIVNELKLYQESLDFSPEKIAACQDRLNVIRNLQKKYGSDIDDIFRFIEKARQDLESSVNYENSLIEQQENIKSLEVSIIEQATVLSTARQIAGKKLGDQIAFLLKRLSLEKSQFVVDLRQRRSESGSPICGQYGFEQVEFLFSANPGEPPRPLKNIASGGELSRVMLAVKSCFAEVDNVNTLVFDEIDAGIGGQTATAVGEHLFNLGKKKQILCITHLASLAVRADNHYTVTKKEDSERAATQVKKIESLARQKEIARMLAGESNEAAALAHAGEMLKKHHAKEF